MIGCCWSSGTFPTGTLIGHRWHGCEQFRALSINYCTQRASRAKASVCFRYAGPAVLSVQEVCGMSQHHTQSSLLRECACINHEYAQCP